MCSSDLADSSKDRTRTDGARPTAPAATPTAAAPKEKPCQCHERQESATASGTGRDRANLPSLSARTASRPTTGSSNGASERRPASGKRIGDHNPSRALVLARRDALAKRGKSATTSKSSVAASVVRQGNPEMSGRELSQKVRELKAKVGSAGGARNGGGTRPSGPNRHGARQAVIADASWKVGASETLSGQTVTGTQANRSPKTTGKIGRAHV